MSGVTIDASVWVAALDPSDTRWSKANELLDNLTANQIAIYSPAFAALEIACALARRLRDSEEGQVLAKSILSAVGPNLMAVDGILLDEAQTLGTRAFLRSADALYAAVAKITGSDLITFDLELIARANAKTPESWLAAQP
jgi:predicted nucleic acid-binding protein